MRQSVHGSTRRTGVSAIQKLCPRPRRHVVTRAGDSSSYSKEMNRKMGTSLNYYHEEGINYNRVLPDLIVGSCLQTPADADFLSQAEGVKVVYCLQEDSDMRYFNLDIEPIQKRCQELGIKHVRFPIRDFDPFDLRLKLPKAVARLAREHNPKDGTAYIHCTAGLGRAPATALAYMNWIRGIQLDDAFTQLLSVRLCGPKIEAIRSATADMLLNSGPVMTTIAIHRAGSANSVQIAGLDHGWNAPHLDLKWDADTKRWLLQRELNPGVYQWKLVVDGHWTYSADHPTLQDGVYTNNMLEVIGSLDSAKAARLSRYMSKGSELTQEEKEEIMFMLCPFDRSEEQAPPSLIPYIE